MAGVDTEVPSQVARAGGRRFRIVRLVQVLLTVAAVGLIALVIDWRQFVAAIGGTDVAVLGLAGALLLLDRLLMSYKWGLLLQAHDVRLPLWQNWGLYSIATLAGTILPATVGGDLLRVTWLWRRGNDTGIAMASIALERLVGFAVGLSLAVASLAYLLAASAAGADLSAFLLPTLTALLLFLIALVLSFHTRVGRALQRYLPGMIGHKLAGWVTRAHSAYLGYLAKPGVVVAFVGLTIVEYLLIVLATYVVARALGIEIGILPFGTALAVAMLVARLPIAIDGIGVFEGAFVLLLALEGVAPGATIALALISRLLNLVVCAPPAALLLCSTALSLSDLRRHPVR